jgi:hypothetical protein
VRLDPSPIPKGNSTANSNRAYFSPNATVSSSGHNLFTRSEADLSRCAVEGSAVSLSITAEAEEENCCLRGYYSPWFSFVVKTCCALTSPRVETAQRGEVPRCAVAASAEAQK